ncbi:YkgJ family cysteine cluster protein [Pusillimonas sp. TS35]|uniref:YkgJ family cysteine cluster protein n=1 Tax=Paracandidimonas lactea TaxID=2895524 RepID=UPI001371134F|nr:YkgJ family cysteine cluster protein [Paracandidimonas lactea]MYN14642.1 YkgJ family cysteine cluster protein [Pusillimonas sp. TS35]
MTVKRIFPAHSSAFGISDLRASLRENITLIPPHRSSAPSSRRPSVRARKQAANDVTIDNPCLSCGACCAHFRVSFYCGEVAGENGGTVPPELVTEVAPLRACMKGTEYGGQRCIALRGELGQPGIHCAIYEQRPSPCREFPAWMDDGTPNPDCQRMRKAIGLPPLPARDPGDDDLVPPNTPPQAPPSRREKAA